MSLDNTQPVLNDGYARLISAMGSDLTIVNAARASFAKESQWVSFCPSRQAVLSSTFCEHCCTFHAPALSEQDTHLIRFLVEHGHDSPFRHCFLSFEIKAPLIVCRQWWRYVVGSTHTDPDDNEGLDWAWSEQSRRYVTDKPQFYIPTAWRSAPVSKKQGSGPAVELRVQTQTTDDLQAVIRLALVCYEQALRDGVCPEQARLMLPAYALYTTWRWSASLLAVSHFLNQRLANDAQFEIREYSKVIYKFVKTLFPISLPLLVKTDE